MSKIYEDLDKIVEIVNRISREVDDAIEDAAMDNDTCDREHCDDYSCRCPSPEEFPAAVYIADLLHKHRMGYELPSTVEVLEEIERNYA